MVTAFVPLKVDSRRVPNKNFLYLGHKPLASYIFETLLSVSTIDNVFCYTSNIGIANILPSGVNILPRPKHLDQDNVKANELFDYAVASIDDSIIVLCHATGPFIKASSILKGIEAIQSKDYDSAMAVLEHKTYSWFNGEPINYKPNDICQTQDLEPLYTETSGFYVFTKEGYTKTKSRVHGRVNLIPIPFHESIDIDEYSDFAVAECMLSYQSALKNIQQQKAYLLSSSSNANSRFKHIAFDFDGVIINSLPAMEFAWHSVVAEFKLDIPFTDYAAHIGKPFYQIIDALGISSDLHDRIYELYEFNASEAIDTISTYPGMRDLLELLSTIGLKISIVTSKSKSRTMLTLEKLLPQINFHTIISSDDINPGRGKPSPDPLLLACIQVGCSPSESIYVGDMMVDQICAREASIPFVHAAWGYGHLEKTNDLWFSDPLELKSALLALSSH